MNEIIVIALWVRVLGYTVMVVAGFLLGLVALGRMTYAHNGRRRQYRMLAMLAFGLSWLATWGIMGVWQYGKISAPLHVPLAVINVGFSAGVAWLGVWSSILAAVVLHEEWRQSIAKHGEGNMRTSGLNNAS